MKTHSIYIGLFLCLTVLFSCKKSSLITYQGKHLLYFSIASVDSVSVNFSLLADAKKDSVLKIPVAMMGNQLATDAVFDIGVNEQITTATRGTDFELPSQFSFRAERSVDTVSLKINRTAKLASKSYVIGLELKSGAAFNNNLLGINTAKNQDHKVRIFISDMLVPTKGWVTTSAQRGTDYYLGSFSKKKLQLVVQLYPYWSFLEMYNGIDQYPSYFGNLLNNYLKAQKAAGTPVLEDDGSLMQSGIFYN